MALAIRRDQCEPAAVGRHRHLFGAQIGARREPAGDAAQRQCRDKLRHARPVAGIDAAERGRARMAVRKLREQALLGLEVRLHRSVVVEMILREVGEGGGLEAQERGALLVQRVGGDLHHRRVAAGAAHRGQQPLQLTGVGRGPRGRNRAAAVLDLYGGQQAGRAAAGTQQLAQQPGGGGFAVRAGDAGHAQRTGGPAVQRGCEAGQRTARIIDRNRLFGRVAHRRLRQHRDRPLGQRGRGITRAIVTAAGQRHEKIARPDTTRIALHAAEDQRSRLLFEKRL